MCARRARAEVPSVGRRAQGARVPMEGRRDARADARPGGVAHEDGQGVRRVRDAAGSVRRRSRSRQTRRQVLGRDGLVQRPRRGVPCHRLARLRRRLRPRRLGRPPGKATVHDADRALRRPRELLPRRAAVQRRHPRPLQRRLAVRVVRIFPPEPRQKRSRLLGDAAQGQPDRLRERRGQRGRRQRAARAPRREAPRVAPAARPLRLDRAAHARRPARALVHRHRRCPARAGQADARRNAPRGGLRRQLGRRRRSDPDRAPPRALPQPVRGPQGAHADRRGRPGLLEVLHRGLRRRVGGGVGRRQVRTPRDHAAHLPGRLRRGAL
mmetsp:Transcript_13658/g.54727  ORF Transcript_13658/g.54727 Transcript_13658/m.54727 type:complete len:325 (+) Transcript_13658:172-1146(+)